MTRNKREKMREIIEKAKVVWYNKFKAKQTKRKAKKP